tara:strand:+ start:1105 stop:1341 length:237 start_codon:yes stop_codon:yes gene_type:complete
MGAPSPPPRPAPAPAPVPKPKPAPVAAPSEPMAQSTEEREKRAGNKRSGRSSLIVNRGGAQGLGGGDDNASIKKKTLG